MPYEDDSHAHGAHSHGPHVHAHPAPENMSARLLASVVVNVAITVAQVVGGVLAGSLALLSDAAHNASDVLGLVLAYAANRAGRLPATERRTYAFKRAEVLAAFVNAAGLLAVSVWVLVEAVGRLLHPQPVEGGLVAVLAGVGLVANAGAAVLLRGGRDLNVRSAFLHLVADAVTSFGVVAGGVIMLLTGWSAVDAVVSIALALWMIRESFGIVRASTDVLLDAVPADVVLGEVQRTILGEEHVVEVHDLHVWSLSSTERALSAHLVTDCTDLADLSESVARIKAELAAHHGIAHSTLELECVGGECAGAQCLLPHEEAWRK
ncbi:cation diffusion facilitator family transporter [Coriobacteriia bacterium Es71-Z0120]|uniref:cation diffusion facilitator family transporter n=1 Tax=Parvivirga hydrogeniphila TaxID=2939460 RepID=UPI002260C8AD|nr:cation diffusion facilitator family transporter [Parvivirga hydrogeniphila]MCL4078129.1 cation diffusion facilitator family transporter [Parvivirga hydrogeniphila]